MSEYIALRYNFLRFNILLALDLILSVQFLRDPLQWSCTLLISHSSACLALGVSREPILQLCWLLLYSLLAGPPSPRPYISTPYSLLTPSVCLPDYLYLSPTVFITVYFCVSMLLSFCYWVPSIFVTISVCLCHYLTLFVVCFCRLWYHLSIFVPPVCPVLLHTASIAAPLYLSFPFSSVDRFCVCSRRHVVKDVSALISQFLFWRENLISSSLMMAGLVNSPFLVLGNWAWVGEWGVELYDMYSQTAKARCSNWA
jgi:hypothetical protein